MTNETEHYPEPFCSHMPDAPDGTECLDCDAEDAHHEALLQCLIDAGETACVTCELPVSICDCDDFNLFF